MVRVQYASDLHITDWTKGTAFETFITPVAPLLVIAGDICSAWEPLYTHFLAWCSRNWYKVILITGNHEYHVPETLHATMEQTDARVQSIAQLFPNVVFLQSGQSYVVPGTRIRFVGATLWSAVDTSMWEEVAAKKGDYQQTYIGTPMGLRKAHPADTTALHALHKSHITSAIAPQLHGETLIVVTHHMPTLHLLEDHFRGERWHTCYVSSDDELFTPNVKAWICGHSHRAAYYKAPSGTLCVMNARGYNTTIEQGRAIDQYSPRATINV